MTKKKEDQVRLSVEELDSNTALLRVSVGRKSWALTMARERR